MFEASWSPPSARKTARNYQSFEAVPQQGKHKSINTNSVKNNSSDNNSELESLLEAPAYAVASPSTLLEGGVESVIDAECEPIQTDADCEPLQTWLSEEPPQPEYRDVIFALLFGTAQCFVFVLAMGWGIPELVKEADEYDAYDAQKSCFLLFLSTFGIGFGISLLALCLLMQFPEAIVLSVGTGLAFLSFLAGEHIFAAILAVLVCYYLLGWGSFASANLVTAVTAIRSNAGVYVVVCGMAGLSIAWIMVWFLAMVGLAQTSWSDSPPIFLFLLITLYWTLRVFRKVVYVTVSGVVGTWWFVPSESGTRDSFVRATTYGFGSICLGIFFEAIFNSIFLFAFKCFPVCCCIKWYGRKAYCYVALQGSDLMTSRKKAGEIPSDSTTKMNDFTTKLQIILIIVCAAVGVETGILGMQLVETVNVWRPFWLLADPVDLFSIFVLIGFFMAEFLMSVVVAAHDTVMVAFVEAQVEFQANHPDLSNNMVEQWGAWETGRRYRLSPLLR